MEFNSFHSWTQIFSNLTMSMIMPLSSTLGLSLMALRFRPLFSVRRMADEHKRSAEDPSNRNALTYADRSKSDRVSFIVPARNEEANLPLLLNSITHLEWEDLEVIVVDDESTDRTPEIAKRFQVENPQVAFKYVKGAPRPEGWGGKNWACHQGYLNASGEWLLFTDADTTHEAWSIKHAIGKMRGENLDLLSATPFHRCDTFWEKLMGPFHIFMFIATAAFSEPRKGRLFAIGQYLLFKRSSYERQGGHEKIKGVLCDDLELAHHCLESDGKYRVEGAVSLYQVRMYARFVDFMQGWRRIFRLGFRHARTTSSVEIYFVISALTAGMTFFAADHFTISLMLLSLLVMAFVQKRFGEFSPLGVLLFPFSLGLFTLISILALFDLMLAREYKWRGRSYATTAD